METENNKKSPTGTQDIVSHRTGESRGKRVINEQVFDYEGWKIEVLKSTILPSKCYCESARTKNSNNSSSSSSPTTSSSSGSSSTNDEESSNSRTEADHVGNPPSCQVCRYYTL